MSLKASRARLAGLLLLSLLQLLCACPPKQDEDPSAVVKGVGVPSDPLPAQGLLLDYEQLKLGLSSVDISQIYNAPEGRGEGFRRLVQDFDGVQHHFVRFDEAESQPKRLLALALLRDELYEIVDRRDGLSADQAKAWKDELVKRYGQPTSMPLEGAQFSWGPENGVLLTFTQDNAHELAMSANVVLVYQPYADAAYEYLERWQQAHPEYRPETLPF